MTTAERASLEERMSRIEGILEEVRTRLNHLETRFEARFGSLEARVHSQFLWLLGIVITMWVTVMAGILGIIAAILARG